VGLPAPLTLRRAPGTLAEVPAPSGSTRATLIDPDRQAAFERDGFVVVDLLDADGVAALQARYDDLDHRHTRDSPFAEGFHTTLYDPRPEYRKAVAAAFEDVLGPALAAVLDRHRLFFTNFTVKLPHAAEVPQHLDWSFVDERRYRSATVWCPLVATDRANGSLGVVVGSHRRVDFVRAVNDRAFDHYQAIAAGCPEHRVVPLDLGQALVMDNRVVHFSPPNVTDALRVVAACIVAPEEADLFHWWYDPDGRLQRLELDPAFYHSYLVGQPPTEADGVRSVTAERTDVLSPAGEPS
jgi:hypothetical protein